MYYECLFKYKFQIIGNSGVPDAAVQLEECVRRRRGAADADERDALQWEQASRLTLQVILEQSVVGIEAGLVRDGFMNWKLTESEPNAQIRKWRIQERRNHGLAT